MPLHRILLSWNTELFNSGQFTVSRPPATRPRSELKGAK